MNLNLKKLFFWQSKKDYLTVFDHSLFGEINLIICNYSIWIFFFIVSYFLIRQDINYFGRLFFATLIAEIVERYLKKKKYWIRPMFNRRSVAPAGLVNNWYYSGSFPSGHTIKTVFFLLFVITTSSFSLPVFLIITIPLLSFRILVGFHYPIDILGGVLFGIIVWFLTKDLVFPNVLNNLIKIIFNFVFSIS